MYFINLAAGVNAKVRYDVGVKIDVSRFFARKFEREQFEQQYIAYNIYKNNKII